MKYKVLDKQNSSSDCMICGLKNPFSARMKFYICEYLGVTPKEFFDYGQRTPAVDNDLYAEIQKLDAKSKEYYMSMIRETNNRPK